MGLTIICTAENLIIYTRDIKFDSITRKRSTTMANVPTAVKPPDMCTSNINNATYKKIKDNDTYFLR